MEEKQQIIEFFQKLLNSEAEILQARRFGGGEQRNTSRGFVGRGQKYTTLKYDKVDYELIQPWGVSCRSLLKNVFGENSEYYIEFKKQSDFFNTNLNYNKFRVAFSILKAAKKDYEEGYFIENPKQDSQSNDNEISQFIVSKLDEEAERNTKCYLIIIFESLILISSPFFYFFGVKYASIFTLIILIISYLISALSLKEWTPTKLPERIFEIEKTRIYKRFGIDT